MTEPTHPLVQLSDADLEQMLRRSIRITLILGVLATVVLCIASDWRTAAMLATGAVISTASIYEWRRLIALINARLDQQKSPRGSAAVVAFFLLRLLVFAGLIYGSLSYFRGSVIALLCGLFLAVAAVAWEAIRLLRN